MECTGQPGTMFVWLKIPKGYASSFDFCMQLVEKTGLLVTPGSAFGSEGEGYIRMALVVDLPVIEEDSDRTRKIRNVSVAKGGK